MYCTCKNCGLEYLHQADKINQNCPNCLINNDDNLFLCEICGQSEIGENAKNCCRLKKQTLITVYGQSVREKVRIPYISKFGTKTEVICSEEMLQDMRSQGLGDLQSAIESFNFYGKILTDDPTEEEIKDWQKYHEFFSKITVDDFIKIKEKYKIKFISSN